MSGRKGWMCEEGRGFFSKLPQNNNANIVLCNKLASLEIVLILTFVSLL